MTSKTLEDHKKVLFLFALFALVLAAAPTKAVDETTADKTTGWQSLVDMSRADVTSFSMRMINNGADVGSMTYGWERDGNRYVIRDRTEMQPNILETAEGVIDAATLLPLSIGINFAVGENKRKYNIAWADNERTGGVVVSQPDTDARTIDFSNPDHPPSALRLSIFGLIAGLPLGEGFSLKLPWYNSLSNKIQNIELVHDGITTIETPAGSFDTHKIDLKGGTPANIIYVSTGLPQKIVRIDVVGQPMHFERLP